MLHDGFFRMANNAISRPKVTGRVTYTIFSCIFAAILWSTHRTNIRCLKFYRFFSRSLFVTYTVLIKTFVPRSDIWSFRVKSLLLRPLTARKHNPLRRIISQWSLTAIYLSKISMGLFTRREIWREIWCRLWGRKDYQLKNRLLRNLFWSRDDHPRRHTKES